MLVAGPMVVERNRNVPHIVNLTEPGRDSIREVNYSALGTNLSSTEAALPAPCVIAAYNLCAIVPAGGGVRRPGRHPSPGSTTHR